MNGGRTVDGRRAALALVAATVVLVLGMLVLVVAGERSPAPDRRPFDLAAVDGEVAGLYRFASQHGDHLSEVPCFCGCEEFLAHRNLEDCFVTTAGGWEPHAAGCGVCTAEAVVVRDAVADGRAVAEARASIIATFGTTPGTMPVPAGGAA